MRTKETDIDLNGRSLYSCRFNDDIMETPEFIAGQLLPDAAVLNMLRIDLKELSEEEQQFTLSLIRFGRLLGSQIAFNQLKHEACVGEPENRIKAICAVVEKYRIDAERCGQTLTAKYECD